MQNPADLFVHRWFEEVWNRNNESAIDDLMHPDNLAFGFPDLVGSIDREGFEAVFRKRHKPSTLKAHLSAKGEFLPVP